MNLNRDQFAIGIGRGMAPNFFAWMSNQLINPRGAKMTLVFTVGFLLISIGWHFTTGSPEVVFRHHHRLLTISEHFVLDLHDLQESRFHVLLTHAFMYQDLPHILLMAIAVMYFGTFIERRVGSWMMCLIFFGGITLGGLWQILIGNREVLSIISDQLGQAGNALPLLDPLMDSLESGLSRLHLASSESNDFVGPAAGVAALLAFAILQEFIYNIRGFLVFAGLGAVWILVDWFGFFHFNSSVGLTARITGSIVGLGFSILFFVCTRSRHCRFRVRNAWCFPE